MYKNHILTPNSVIIVTDHGSYTVNASHSHFENIRKLIASKNFEKIEELLSAKTRIEKNSPFKLKDGCVVIEGKRLPKSISDIIIHFAKNECDYSPILKFWEKVNKNPLQYAKEELYLFLETGHFPITKDGDFIAYKKINSDWTDCYSGTYDNRPGKIVSMRREDCDARRENTCSRGLHVANWSYAETFSNGKMVEVLVNPKDVVSVPNDHNNTKMRVCKYKVLREVTEENKDIVYSLNTNIEKPKKLNKEKECPTDVFIVGNRGRLRVNSMFISELGDVEHVWVTWVEDALVITKTKKNNKSTKYAVDNNSIKIAKGVLTLISKNPKYFRIVYNKKSNQIVITKK